MTNYSATSQVAVLAGAEATVGASRSAQVVALVAADQTVLAPSARMSQVVALVASQFSAQPSRTAQAVALLAYNEGSRENNNLRAWSFVLDGNVFYVLHLGDLGSYVCNLTQGNQWSRWVTEGMVTWNAEQGLMWDGRIVAGDSQNTTLWIVDPEQENDEEGFKPIRRTATVLIPARGRKTISVDMFSINAATGNPSTTNAELSVRFSDDNGATWFSMASVVFEDGNFNQNLQFGSMGSFGQPGRILEVSDFGGSMRLSDIDGEFTGGDPWEA